jgi:hypothetical protein
MGLSRMRLLGSTVWGEIVEVNSVALPMWTTLDMPCGVRFKCHKRLWLPSPISIGFQIRWSNVQSNIFFTRLNV